MTNRDRINKMSNEDMALTITNYVMAQVYGKRINKNECITDNIAQWLSQEIETTADKLFIELGYRKVILDKEKAIKYEKGNYSIYIFYKNYSYIKTYFAFSSEILEDEDRAIHEKIKELKNGQRD